MSDLATSTLSVHRGVYRANLRAIRDMLPEGCGLLAVVKSDAYGLGAAELAPEALAAGATMLGVAAVGEGVELREAGIESPILVMAQPRESDLTHALEYDLRIMISEFATAERLGDLARKAKTIAQVHCEIDTGMGRQGFGTEEAPGDLLALTRISNIDIEGVATHFPSADVLDDPFTENQLRTFRQLVKQLDRDGIPYETVHAANSAAIVNYPASALDMVRTGIMTYGVWPQKVRPEDCPIQPVAEWTTRVVLVKEIAGGASIGYGRTYKAPSPIRTAVLPIGYADGFSRSLSNHAEVLIRGQRCPVRGAVSMNQTVVDISRVPEAAVGDKVTLLGHDNEERITLEELAQKAHTIEYEILTGIGPSVARVYKG